MTTITAAVESLGEVGPAEQARRVISDRTISHRRAGRGWNAAVFISIGITEVAWCALLGWAAWTLL